MLPFIPISRVTVGGASEVAVAESVPVRSNGGEKTEGKNWKLLPGAAYNGAIWIEYPHSVLWAHSRWLYYIALIYMSIYVLSP